MTDEDRLQEISDELQDCRRFQAVARWMLEQLTLANREIRRLEEMEKRAKSEYSTLWSASTPAEAAGVSTSVNATVLRSLRFILGFKGAEKNG